jgi:excisionase family DNA binding protein
MLKVKQVAERLNVSASKVYELVETDQLPHYRIDGSIRVSDEQLSTYLAECEHGRGEKAKAWPERARPVKLKHLR